MKLIKRIYTGIFNIIDELLSWTDELVAESKAARLQLQAERTKQLAEASKE
jgi:hypothetical protein